MKTMQKSLSVLGILMMTMMTMSGAATAQITGVAHDDADWGMRYDWTNLDADSQTVLGTSFTQIITDLEADMAAEGINIDIEQAIAGTSEFYVEVDTMSVTSFSAQDANGNSHLITSARVTELTVRSVILVDLDFDVDWDDTVASAGVDITVDAEAHKALLMDLHFTEYMDVNGDVVQVKMTGGMAIEVAVAATIDGSLEGTGSILTLPMTTVEATAAMEISNIDSLWSLGTPTGLYDTIGQLDSAVPGLIWDCESGATPSVVQQSNTGMQSLPNGMYANDWYHRTDDCGSIDVSFDYEYSYELEATNWPSASLGFSTANLNVQLSDVFTGSVQDTNSNIDWISGLTRLSGVQQHDVDGDGTQDTLWEMDGDGSLLVTGLPMVMFGISAESLEEIDTQAIEDLKDSLEDIESDFDQNTGIIGDIIDAIDASTLEDQLEDAGAAFEQGTIDPIETHLDQTWGSTYGHMLWDDDAQAFVGLQFIGTVNGNVELIMGLETSTHNTPLLNVEYLTNGDASAAQNTAASMTTIQDLLNSVSLPQSGAGIGNGMLPSAGAFATLGVAIMGAVICARRDTQNNA